MSRAAHVRTPDIGQSHLLTINISTSRVDECITLRVYVIIIYIEAGMRAQVRTRRLRTGSLRDSHLTASVHLCF